MTSKPTAILASDLHAMAKTPECRLDDFQQTQHEKWQFIDNLCQEYDCPLLCGGDVFDKHNPPLWLVNRILQYQFDLVTPVGNHDVSGHNLANLDKSGLGTLGQAGMAYILQKGKGEYVFGNTIVHGFSWGDEPTPIRRKKKGYKYVALIHTMVYQGNDLPFIGAEKIGGNSKKLMESLRGYDLIVSGDNHNPFTEKRGEQLLVNCGSLMRIRSSQKNYKPAVYAWFSETNTVEPIYLPIKKEYVTTRHLKASKEKEARISAFVEKLGSNFDVSLSFDDNIKKYLLENDINDAVKEIVMEAMHD